MPALRPFQREDVEFIKKNNLKVLIASAPGTGKTGVAIRSLVETKSTFPTLVICPATVTRNWEKEVQKWAKGIRCVIIEDMDSRIRLKPGAPTLFIISWSLLDARLPDLLRLPIQSIVADEAHYSKNMDSQRSQALFTLSKKVKHLLLLTGTPIVNNKSELAVLYDLLGSEKPPMIRRLLEDVAPDIPPKTRSYLNIKLRPADQAEYNKANEEFEIWLKERKAKLLGEGAAQAEVDRILAAEALAKIGYLRRMLGDAKVPACSDFIARAVRMGEPVVCFVEHQTALERLSRALNKQRIRHEIIDGSTTPKKRQEIVERFQKYEFPVFIGTRAAKEGITLTAARHLIFLERFFTSADEEQAEDRVRRIGQTLPTTIWFLHALGTVDERVDQIVKQKRQVIRSAIGSATVEETPLLAVEEMIKNWQKHIDDTGVSFPGLGLGTILPPLPSPKETHAVTFSGKEWHLHKALLWCKMNGYIPTGKTDLNGRFKLIMHPPQIFNKNKFKIFSVSKDIKIIHGERLSKANERRIRKQLRQLR